MVTLKETTMKSVNPPKWKTKPQLTNEQEILATERLLDLLDKAYRSRPKRGLWSRDLRRRAQRELSFELRMDQVRELLRASGRAQYDGNLWRLTEEELVARFSYGRQRSAKGDAA
jgi:hypothetical protein